jgi:hypothetical protein
MPLVLAESWLRAANSGAAPVWLVAITYGATTIKAVSASCAQFKYPESVLDVDPFSAEIDVLTRKLKISETEVKVQDAWLRPHLVANRLQGQKCQIKLGFTSIPEADFCSCSCGPIEEITPDGIRDDGIITLTVCSVLALLEKAEISGAWFNIHPLQALYKGDGTGILERCQIPAAMIDTASFDPTDGRYSTISHWCVSRVWDWDVMKPENGLELADSVCNLLNGQLVETEDGLVSFKRFDSTAAIVDTFTMNDVLEDGPIEPDAFNQNVINQFSMSFGGGQYTDHGWVTFELNDTDSQSAYAYPGTAKRVLPHKIKTEWIGSYHAMPSADLAAGAASVTVQAQVHAISGNRATYPGPQPASASVSASRPVWLYVGNILNPAEPGEVVKATACTVSTATSATVQSYADPGLGTTPDMTYRNSMAFSSMTRGQLGTTDQAHSRSTQTCQTNVWDISILATLGQELLQRFKYGCDPIRLYTSTAKMALQRGDLIGTVFPGLLGYGMDGDDGSRKWEVTRKEVSATRIGWTIAPAGVVANSGGGRGYGRDKLVGSPQLSAGVSFAEASRGIVSNGAVWSAGAALAAGMSAGASAFAGGRKTLAAVPAHTFDSSKDTWVAADAITGDVAYYPVNNGAAMPTKQEREVWLAKVVTNGAAVTSIDNSIKETLPLDYDKVKDGATWIKVQNVSAGHQVVAASIASNAVEEAKINAGAVTEGKLGAGAVTSGKIGDRAVGAAAVADGAIGGVHVSKYVIGSYANGNANFGKRTRQ